MKTKKQNIYTVKKKRILQGKTNYKKRIALVSSKKHRAVIIKSLKHLTVQFVSFDTKGDIVKVKCRSQELKKLGWDLSTSNLSASYLTGILGAKKAKSAGIEEAIVDIGIHPSVKGSRIYALIKGLVDGGLKVPCDPSMFPSNDRLNGKHVVDYYNMKKENFKESPAKIHESFEKVKNSLMKK